MKLTSFKTLLKACFIALFAMPLVGCSKGNNEKLALLPSLELECDISQVSDCTADKAGKNVFVGLSLDNNTSCADRFTLVPAQYMVQSFDYSANVPLTDQGTYLLAIARNWQGYNYAPQINFTNESYQVCAFIDFNNNGVLDTFEPFHESTFTGGPSFLRITNWEIF